jgi:hypothetical protein
MNQTNRPKSIFNPSDQISTEEVRAAVFLELNGRGN